MTPNEPTAGGTNRDMLTALFSALVMIGLMTFIVGLLGKHPEKAWQSYLINFLLWSAVAQGGLLFSVIMHITRARWSGPLEGLSGAFAAFFPISFVLFLLLFLGHNYVFPWAHHDLHGKEVWLNVPFLFSRNLVGLLVLYGLGFAFLYHALWFRLGNAPGRGRIRSWLGARWAARMGDEEKCRHRMTVFAILYALAFAVILSLIGYDLVMATDPHWYSTLFGAYSFVKAIYVGFGGLIILAAVLHLSDRNEFGLKQSEFHDIGKLFFAFCLVWADFFYAQFVVLWYGNIPEETAFIIERTMTAPWSWLAWTVFVICFILPFLILINKKIKTSPKAMIVICAVVIVGMWLEHHLLIAPSMGHGHGTIGLGVSDALISLGFLGLMAFALAFYLKIFPEIVVPAAEEVN